MLHNRRFFATKILRCSIIEVLFVCLAYSRLAAIDCVGGDSGVKPKHRLRDVTCPPSLTVIGFF